jgi:hypothetical protein
LSEEEEPAVEAGDFLLGRAFPLSAMPATPGLGVSPAMAAAGLGLRAGSPPHVHP